MLPPPRVATRSPELTGLPLALLVPLPAQPARCGHRRAKVAGHGRYSHSIVEGGLPLTS